MAVDTQKLVVRSGVKVELARYTGTTLGTFGPITPRGSVQVNSGFGTQTYADFSTALGVIAPMAPDGDRTVSVTFNTFLVPSAAVYEDVYEIHENAEEFVLRVTWTDRAGTGTAVRQYKGYIPTLNETGNQDGAAEAAITFNASAKYVTP